MEFAKVISTKLNVNLERSHLESLPTSTDASFYTGKSFASKSTATSSSASLIDGEASGSGLKNWAEWPEEEPPEEDWGFD